MKIVLDTCALSALMQADPTALRHVRRYRPGDVVLTSPVAAEIRYGLERLPTGSRRRRLLTDEYAKLRQQLRWVDWNEDAANEFGRQKARLAERGTLIEDMDLAIGSLAVVLGVKLATMNLKHMGRLEGVTVEDWST